jgi:Ca2+-binding RTX toxin-like protein
MATIHGKKNATVHGTKSDDNIYLSGKSNAYGGAGDDHIEGSDGNNKIYGQDGDDFIDLAEGGRDSAWGGRGDDTLWGLYSGGPLKLYGDAGQDFLLGSGGDDFLNGGAGNDSLFGNGGKDTARGGTGDDTFFIGGIHDEVYYGTSRFDGNAGRDTLAFDIGRNPEVWITGESKGHLTTQNFDTGESEVRLVFTGTNVITTEGSSEPVSLIYHGGDSDNTVIGSSPDDMFIAGKGSETFTGGGDSGGGNDFVFDFLAFDPNHPNELPMGHDVITDFDSITDGPGDGIDTLSFRGGEGQMTTTAVEHDGITTYTSTDNDGHVLHILDVNAVGLGDWWVV